MQNAAMAPKTGSGTEAACGADEAAAELPDKRPGPGGGNDGFLLLKGEKEKKDAESQDGSTSDAADATPGRRTPMSKWVMNGAIMFGREFCYAMETALVTPVLLQIGLPEQYYSLTWFLSPVLGLIFTPLIGSASDRCTLKWGRRRPFILALAVGVLLGVALFLNGSVIGLAAGDRVGKQPIGIVLTVLGVVVLDFAADASEGPIRAYLLDVADTEEQDMALNIHAFSAGLGGAVGYMLGGLNWTNTALGRAFGAQEQVLFFFAAIIFTVSVTLHLFSIQEQPYSRQQQQQQQQRFSLDSEENADELSVGRVSLPKLDLIGEEDESVQGGDELPERSGQDLQMDFLSVDMVRSKSDSVLAMPDATIQLDPDLDLDRTLGLIPDVDSPFVSIEGDSVFQDAFQPALPSTQTVGSSQRSLARGSVTREERHSTGSIRTRNGALVVAASSSPGASDPPPVGTGNQQQLGGRVGQRLAAPAALAPYTRHRHFSFYRQPSFTFSYYGRVGFHRRQRARAGAMSPATRVITSTQSMSDLYEIGRRRPKRRHHRSPRRPRPRGTSESSSSSEEESEDGEGDQDLGTTVKLLWLSMLKMPRQLARLCLCHLLTWFAIMAEAIFYSDFMGQVIYEGKPTAPANSTEFQNYHKGVQMGCWGLVIYAATAAVCSAVLQKYLDNFDLSIKIIYMMGTLGFAVGTAVMAIFPNVYVAMVMISTMGIFSMSISYCPYALLGQYHEIKEYVLHSPANSRRGFGIDCAILTCQVYVAQILVASALGAVVDAVGTVRVIPIMASGGSLLGFLTATFLVIYPDLPDDDESEDEEEEEEAACIRRDPSVTVMECHLDDKPSGLALRNNSCKLKMESSI